MADKIHVLSKRPGCPPRSVWVSNTLENLQRAVGGYIETFTLSEDCCVICNEEGRLLGMPYNCTIAGVSFVGDILLVGVRGEEFADLPVDYRSMKNIFPRLWECEEEQDESKK